MPPQQAPVAVAHAASGLAAAADVQQAAPQHEPSHDVPHEQLGPQAQVSPQQHEPLLAAEPLVPGTMRPTPAAMAASSEVNTNARRGIREVMIETPS